MERLLDGKQHKHDGETSKSRPKKASKRIHSGDDKLSGSSYLKKRSSEEKSVKFLPLRPSKESVFKKLDPSHTVASCQRLRRTSVSQSHKSKDLDIKKILGVICGDDSSKKKKKHYERKPKRDSSACSGSSSNSQSLINERKSHRKSRKRMNERSDCRRRFVRDDETQNGEFFQRYVREDEQRSDEDRCRRISEKLSFTSSDSEKESPSLGADYKFRDFGSPVQDKFSRTRKLDVEKSPEIVTTADKEKERSPILGKNSRHDDQETLADYMDLTNEVTDELTLERLKLWSGKSYLDTVTQNLLSVFPGRSEEDMKQTKKGKSSKQDVWEDFTTPAAAGEIIDPTIQNDRKNKRRMKSPKIQHPAENFFCETQNFPVFQDTESVVPKESLRENIFSQPKPRPPPSNFPGQVFDFGKPEEEQPPNIFLSPEILPDALEDLDTVTFLKKMSETKRNMSVGLGNDATDPAISCSVSKSLKGLRPRTSPERLYPLLPSPPLHFSQNDYVHLSERERFSQPRERTWKYHEKEMGRPSRTSCTATVSRPVDHGFMDNPFVIPEAPFKSGHNSFEPTNDFLDSYQKYEQSVRDPLPRISQPQRDGPSNAHYSHLNRFKESANIQSLQQESFLGNLGLKNTEGDKWIVSPKYYKRRMF